MIGSHNTFSCLPTTKWWMKLLSPWHRCQNEQVLLQLDSGVKYLDIRIRFVNGSPVFVHNHITYKSCFSFRENMQHMAWFIKIHFSTPIYYRLILDVRKCPKDYARQRSLFKSLIQELRQVSYCKYLVLDEARIFWDWDDPIIKSRFTTKEYHASVSSKWYQYILGTKWFAKRFNKNAFQAEADDKQTVYLIDYINLGKSLKA